MKYGRHYHPRASKFPFIPAACLASAAAARPPASPYNFFVQLSTAATSLWSKGSVTSSAAP